MKMRGEGEGGSIYRGHILDPLFSSNENERGGGGVGISRPKYCRAGYFGRDIILAFLVISKDSSKL